VDTTRKIALVLGPRCGALNKGSNDPSGKSFEERANSHHSTLKSRMRPKATGRCQDHAPILSTSAVLLPLLTFYPSGELTDHVKQLLGSKAEPEALKALAAVVPVSAVKVSLVARRFRDDLSDGMATLLIIVLKGSAAAWTHSSKLSWEAVVDRMKRYVDLQVANTSPPLNICVEMVSATLVTPKYRGRLFVDAIFCCFLYTSVRVCGSKPTSTSSKTPAR